MTAVRQGPVSRLTRRTVVRANGCGLSIRRLLLALAAAASLGGLIGVAAVTPAGAQSFTYNPLPPRPKPPKVANDNQMLVQATEVDYDYNNSRVSAVGNVQLFYNGTSVEADRVIYDQKTKRLHAEGNIRMTDADGKITYAEIMDLSDDYRDGFVDSLRVDTADQTRMAASRADRSSGNYTVFENGVYTACAPCRDDPKKPPLWQVKGARIIHDQQEKMLYFETAQLEFFGVPLAYMPYFSTPDPTVKRKTGFLMPGFSSYSAFGYGLEVPFYWAIAPDMDATFSPRVTSKQGVLLQAEFRQRLMDGAYQIRVYGIDQLDPSKFAGLPGERQFRGRRRNQGPVRTQRQMGLGLGRRPALRLLFHVGLPLVGLPRSARIVPEPADGCAVAALSDRRRQSQLLRRAYDVLAELLGQPEPGAGRLPRDRLFERPQLSGVRRRVQLQDQFREPVA
ncbi:lipopolysaccharide assembly outer membrane protein LptD (OstA) [Bradyrhizobium sp. LM2.7]